MLHFIAPPLFSVARIVKSRVVGWIESDAVKSLSAVWCGGVSLTAGAKRLVQVRQSSRDSEEKREP